MTLMLATSLAYARRGWHVPPVRPRAKEPLTARGHLDATTDLNRSWPRSLCPREFHRWWRRWPDANVGLSRGASEVLALDVDPRHGGDSTLRRLTDDLGSLPLTVCDATGGGGWHLFFRAPTGGLRGNLGCRIKATTTADYARTMGIALRSLKDITTGQSQSQRIQNRIDDAPPEVVTPHPWPKAAT